MNYERYTVEELVKNDSFRRLVRGTATPEEMEKWNSWIEAHPENRKNAKAAMAEIAGFAFQAPDLPDLQEEWEKIYKKTAKTKPGLYPIRRKRGIRRGRFNWFFRVAAVILFMSAVGVGIMHLFDDSRSDAAPENITREETVQTEEGEWKTLTFSNNSKIVLNSNSTLSYRLRLDGNQTIEVTLDGEAWFETDSDFDETHPSFAVTTPDGIVRDIGTKFLVTVHPGNSRVVLQEGIVEVEVEPAATSIPSTPSPEKSFRVQPGEMVEFTKNEILTRERVNPTFYTAWATQHMEFDQTPIRDFALYVEERFGVNVQIVESSLEEITLDGAVYFRSLEELVRSVSSVTGIPVFQSESEDTVIIGRQHPEHH